MSLPVHEERHVWGNATDAFFTREEAEEALADGLRDEPSSEQLLLSRADRTRGRRLADLEGLAIRLAEREPKRPRERWRYRKTWR